MQRPVQRFQIDIKFVPSTCLKNPRGISEKFYQFTAIDKYSRWRFVQVFDEHNSYSAPPFVDHLVKAFPYRIESKKLKRYNTREYNHFPMRPLGWKTPSQMLKEFQPDFVTHN